MDRHATNTTRRHRGAPGAQWVTREELSQIVRQQKLNSQDTSTLVITPGPDGPTLLGISRPPDPVTAVYDSATAQYTVTLDFFYTYNQDRAVGNLRTAHEESVFVFSSPPANATATFWYGSGIHTNDPTASFGNAAYWYASSGTISGADAFTPTRELGPVADLLDIDLCSIDFDVAANTATINAGLVGRTDDQWPISMAHQLRDSRRVAHVGFNVSTKQLTLYAGLGSSNKIINIPDGTSTAVYLAASYGATLKASTLMNAADSALEDWRFQVATITLDASGNVTAFLDRTADLDFYGFEAPGLSVDVDYEDGGGVPRTMTFVNGRLVADV